MADTVEKAASMIRERLSELEGERKRLESALAWLSDGNGSARRSQGRPKGSTTRSRRSGKRAPRGEREQQLLASIQKNPNYKPSDHAREIGVSPNQIYGLVTKLVKAGKVTKNKNGLKVKATA